MNTQDKKNRSGKKAYNLQILQNNGFDIPSFLVVEADLFENLLDDSRYNQLSNIDESLDSSEAFENMRSLFSEIVADHTFVQILQKELDHILKDSDRFAVRSSSKEEDGEEKSYAGQFDSYLNVERKNLAESVIKVWGSAYSHRIEEYRKIQGLNTVSALPSVIIQKMVDATAAGVAFSACPISGDRKKVVINSVNGLADKLVDGELNGAHYEYEDKNLVLRENEKDGMLTHWQRRKLLKAVKAIETLFEKPQDIEWAFQGNKLFILQARDITTIEKVKSSLKRVDVFDNSNIGESYPGVTTPLTFSFARCAYQNVYYQFCLLMGVNKKLIEENNQIFPQMLGYINGRIYYNLLNWYRLLMLFPGYKTNESFMEQMMGVGESIDKNDLGLEEKPAPDTKEMFFDRVNLLSSIFGLFFQLAILKRTSKRFQTRLNTALSSVPDNLDSLELPELVKLYRSLEKELLTKWDAPIVNDFFAMIFYGLLKKLCVNWVEVEGLHNQLLCGESGIISTEPARLLKEMASVVKDDPVMLKKLEEESVNTDLNRFAYDTEFNFLLNAYIEKFGDRSPGELKLESKTLKDEPGSVLSAVYALAQRDGESARPEQQRLEAEEVVKSKLKSNPVRRILFNIVLSQARERIKARENLRFERTRVFGAVRKIFVAAGKILSKENQLTEASDIFYLEVEEVLRHVEGTATSNNLKALATIRRKEHEVFNSLPAPPDRIRTINGARFDVLAHQDNKPTKTDSITQANVDLNGKGCCPGVVEGRARVIVDPARESMKGYDILIAERTDPGWIGVISQAKAIVVEYGSLLSHTAIVARELGIPTIVAAANVTKEISTGDRIVIDGQVGTVRIIESSTNNSHIPEEGMNTEVA